MKTIFPVLFFLLFIKGYSQEVIRASFADSCIITSVTLDKTDFKKMPKLCPHELKEVKGFKVSISFGGSEKEFHFKGNRWDKKIFDTIIPGTEIRFDDITGIDTDGHEARAFRILVSIK